MADPIHPYKVYTPKEACKLLRVDKSVVYDALHKKKIKHIRSGKAYKILGENLLSYAGSATYPAEDVKTKYSGGVPSPDELTWVNIVK